MSGKLLEISQLRVCTEGKAILYNLSLSVNLGEMHVVMGPNGSGKSTLVNTLAGQPDYTVAAGKVDFAGEDLLAMAPHERALKGLFLAFQHSIEIPGVSNMEFLKISLDHVCHARGEPPLGAAEFVQQARAIASAVGLPAEFLKRNVNEGFSGGEKKRNEIMQMIFLKPTLCLLDEIDSGLDIDALKMLARNINSMRDENRSFILITHYQRLLNYIVPDRVHVLSKGKIIHSGDHSVALKLEAQGYSWLEEDQPKSA